jgi:hypothetical protein
VTGVRERLLNPVITLKRVMDFYDDQDFESDDDLIDRMVASQRPEELRELVEYLDPLLADASVTEPELLTLLERAGGGAFAGCARESLARLSAAAHDELSGKVYRPTRGD